MDDTVTHPPVVEHGDLVLPGAPRSTRSSLSRGNLPGGAADRNSIPRKGPGRLSARFSVALKVCGRSPPATYSATNVDGSYPLRGVKQPGAPAALPQLDTKQQAAGGDAVRRGRATRCRAARGCRARERSVAGPGHSQSR